MLDQIFGKIGRRLKKVVRRLTRKRRYAIHNLDILLETFMDYRNGFFIEVGANDGLSQSNTRYFEQYKGWRGLLIEAIPDLADKCKKNRPKSIVENYALVGNDYPLDYIEIHYCNLMSVIENDVVELNKHIQDGQKLFPKEKTYTVKVPAITLSEMLEKHKISKIDLLSLDVEGFEANVLKGLDLEKYRPKFLLIEVRDIETIENVINKFYKKIAVLYIEKKYSDILYQARY